jgi:peroxiredoxin
MGIVVVMLVPFFLLYFSHRTVPYVDLMPGDVAPDIVLSSIKNELLYLRPDSSKGLALLFFTTSCPHCKLELVHFEALCRRYASDVDFVAVSLSDRDKTEEFLAQRAFSFAICLDVEKKARESYGVPVVPTIFFIDPRSNIQYRSAGVKSIEAHEQAIKQLIEGVALKR